MKNDITGFIFGHDIYIAKIATVAVTLQAVYCFGVDTITSDTTLNQPAPEWAHFPNSTIAPAVFIQ